MKTVAQSILRKINEEISITGDEDTYGVIENNRDRLGMTFVNASSEEIPNTMVIEVNGSSVTFASREGQLIIVTSYTLDSGTLQYSFTPNEVDYLYRFNDESTKEMERVALENQYPPELLDVTNIKEFGQALFNRFNIDVHNPSLMLQPVSGMFDPAIRTPGSILIVIGEFQFGIRNEKRAAIFKVLENNRLETVYNPDLDNGLDDTSLNSNNWKNLIDSGASIYTIDQSTAKGLSTDSVSIQSLDSSDSGYESKYLDPRRYRISLARIVGDDEYKSAINSAIDFSESFSVLCNKKHKEYINQRDINPNVEKNMRSLVSKLTQLDYDITESISRLSSYRKKINEGKDSFLVELDKKYLNRSVSSLKNLVHDLKHISKSM